MSRFFAVLLLLLYAVVCQTAPTKEVASLNPAPQDSSNQPCPTEVSPSPTARSLSTSASTLKNPPPTTAPVNQPETQPSASTPTDEEAETQPPTLTPTDQSETRSLAPPQILQTKTQQLVSPSPPQSDQPEIQPIPEPPSCPLPLPMPPCSEENLEQFAPPPQQPPRKRTGWRNGLLNLVSACATAIANIFTDMVVITGEYPPKKCNKRNYIISFGKKRPLLCEQTNQQSGRVKKPKNSFWYKDLRSPATPRARVGSCATSPDGSTKQCNFCCVGENVVNCSNCININCSPQINCCSCTINVTVVNMNVNQS